LQAALALESGFEEIVWTVDPLRAANAKLNFERLGAYAGEYLRDVYGSDFGAGLYGGMPTDRFLVTWPVQSERVRSRLLGLYEPLTSEDLVTLPDHEPGVTLDRARIAVPSNIDDLVAREPTRAREWRFWLRARLESAFSDGYVVTGFAGRRGAAESSYLIDRVAALRLGRPPAMEDG
jgi:predicted GNAT superfamily acetyltransferase